MLGQQKNGIDLICNEQSIPEFPSLLFGKEIESGRHYFDATVYLHKEAQHKNIKDFFIQYKKPIESLCEAYDIPYDLFYKINKSGHYLIDGSLAFLFIAFVEPNFLGYIFDRIQELFYRGVTVSDTYLLSTARERLPKEILEAAISNDDQQQTE